MKVNLKKDSVYRDFYVVDVKYIPDYDLNSVFLRHKTTGLEVYHLVSDDEENLFSFLFRTPVFDSKGMPHIIEHSVLCGSEKYHLKEPFNTLCNSSVKTFANACTWEDFTGYPASSIVEKDFFNMMDIYADAVYFPLLEERTFRQEGHRFEIEDDGSLSIQGVVYNEMKANITNFYRVYSEEICKAVHPYPASRYNSGGDPLEVMTLDYEDFVNFHKNYYRPSNSLVFLYGNIPTEKHLDFLADNYIPRMEEKYGKVELSEDQLKTYGSLVPENLKSYYAQKHDFVKGNYRGKGISTGVNGNVVSVNWSIGKEGMDQYYMSEYLFGEESSPLAKVLKESELGDDLAPMMGAHNTFEDGVFSIGLKGVKKEDEQKVIEKIFHELKEIVSKPVDQDLVDSAVNKIDFNVRQEYRNYGAPYSFVIMEKCACAWKHGMNPGDRLTPITSFEGVKAELKKDKDFTNKLIKKYLLDNSDYSTFVLEPSDDYMASREKSEKDFIAAAEKSLDMDALKKMNDELHAYQERVETSEELSVVPRLEIKDLTAKRPLGVTEIGSVKNHKGDDILLFKNIENTKGIVYFDVLFPIEKMDLKYYPYLSILSEILLDMGWNGKTWDQADREDLQDIPNLYAMIFGGTINSSDSAQAFAKKNEHLNFIGRTWLRISMNILAEKMDTAFEKLALILKTIDFKDTEHLSTMLKAGISNRKQNFVNNSLDYAFKRLAYTKSPNSALQEILWGITGYENSVNLDVEKCGEYLEACDTMYRQIKEGGAIVHFTTDKNTAGKLEKVIGNFVKDAKLLPLTAEKPRTTEELTGFVCQTSSEKNEYINIDSQVGYATMEFPCSKYVTREFIAELLFTSWFSGHTLWDKLRTVNGAYGAGMWLDPSISQTYFYSYRDPRPDSSIQTVLDALEEVKKNGITKEDVNDTILSEFGQMTTPSVARDKGANSFNRTLFAQTNDQMEDTISILKTLTPEDVMAALDRIIERIKDRNEMNVLQNNVKGSGNLLKVTL